MSQIYINNTNVVEGANAKIAALQDGSFLVVWAQDASNNVSNIVAERFYEYGGIEYNLTQISDITLNVTCTNPLISVFSDDTFTISWLSSNLTACQILTQSFYIDTTPLSEIQSFVYQKECEIRSFMSDAVVDENDNKIFFVAWSNISAISVQTFFVNASTALFSTVSQCTFYLGNISLVDMLAFANDTVLLSWKAQISDESDLLVQKFNTTNCQNITKSLQINTYGYDVNVATIAALDSAFIVAWVQRFNREANTNYSLYIQSFYNNLIPANNYSLVYSSAFTIATPPAIAVAQDYSFEITWSHGIAEAELHTHESTNIVLAQSYSSNGTALNQTIVTSEDFEDFPPEIISFPDGAFGVMWMLSSMQSSHVKNDLVVDVGESPAIVCPASITFGTPARLSPSNIDAINAAVAYFNGNGYVAIWSVIDNTNPKVATTQITAQLFDSNNAAISSQTYSVMSQPTSKFIGASTVGVFEDRSFVVAWSTLTRTGSPWQLSIQYYQYIPATTTTVEGYTTQNIPLINLQSSNHNKGRFSLATLPLDNAFIIATMQDQHNMMIARYNYNFATGICEQQYKVTEPVTISYLTELIIKAVPTQYFFTVVWSALSKSSDNVGIFLQNYNSTDGLQVIAQPMSIISNPRAIFADLSYGGTIIVAWHEASTDCNNQQVLSYSAQMFNSKDQLSIVMPIANDMYKQSSNLELADWTWLHQVTAFDESFTVSFINNELLTVRMFNNEGMITSSTTTTNSVTQAPGAPPLTMVPTPPPTLPTNAPAPELQNLGYKLVGFFSCFSSAASDLDGAIINDIRLNVPDKGCTQFNTLRSVCKTKTEEQRSNLNAIINYNIIPLENAATTIPLHDREFRLYRELYVDLYKQFLGMPSKVIREIDELTPDFLLNRVTYRFDCSFTFSSSYVNVKAQSVYLCKNYAAISNLPNASNSVFRSKLSVLVRSLYKLAPSWKTSVTDSYDSCVITAKSYEDDPLFKSGCPAYFFGAIFTIQQQRCQRTLYSFLICNTTEEQSYLGVNQNIEELEIVLNTLTTFTSFSSLSHDLQYWYRALMGVQNTWTIALSLFKEMLKLFINDQPFIRIIYGASYTACYRSSTTNAYTYGDQSKTVILCNNFVGFDILPTSQTFKDQTKFKTLTHELSHIAGTADAPGPDQPKIYGFNNCINWASNNSINSPSDIIADCAAYFVVTALIQVPAPHNRQFIIQQEENTMPKIDNLIFDISVVADASRHVTMTLTLTNGSPNDYSIHRDVILLDGFRVKFFHITGPSVISCAFRTSDYPDSGLTLFHSGNVLTSTLELSKVCPFWWAQPGTYTVSFDTKFSLYSSSVDKMHYSKADEIGYSDLIGSDSFVLGDDRSYTREDLLSSLDF